MSLRKKRGVNKFALTCMILLMLFFAGLLVTRLTGYVITQATVSLIITAPEEKNMSIYGVFEPLCCSGGTGDWCLDNDVYNETTGTGDIYCEGSTAGNDILVNVQHILKFNFTRITVDTDDVLECVLEQSDGSLLIVNETGLSIDHGNYILEYAISNDSIITRNESASIHDLPWGVHNCSIIYSNGSIKSWDIKEVIFVHRNLQWNTFDYQKALFAESVPYKFFNNTQALNKYYIEISNKSYSRYLSFRHYAGSDTEEFCFDGIDNDNDGDIDSEDYDCRTFMHRYNSTMNYTIPGNFLSILAFFKDILGNRITANVVSSDDDNIVQESLGSVNYWYTLNTNLNGSFKIRIYETSPGSSGYGYTIKGFPNISSVSIIGTTPSGYSSSYACGSLAGQPEGICNVNFDCSACGDELVDFVYIINSYNTTMDAVSSLTFESVHGTTVEEEHFNVYFDPNEGLNNTYENESSTATDSNLCDDGVNNDLDISEDYSYINFSSGTNRITLSRDCADIDCAGIIGPSYTAEQDITFSQGTCEYKIETNCSDGYDNDFNNNYSLDAYGLLGIFYTDCHDVDCFRNGVECPSSETICNDGINNDWDYTDTNSESDSGHKIGNTDNDASNGAGWNNLPYNHINRTYQVIDCEDFDCNGSIGGSNGEICQWAHEINCSDGFNNDALQQYDCENDGNTYGVVGNSEPPYSHLEYDCSNYCRVNVDNSEKGSECDDGIDNDWDYWINSGIFSGTPYGGIDCGWNGTGKNYNPDLDCDGEIMSSGYRCEIGIELTCNDSFDNDYDDKASDSSSRGGGWNSTLYNAYFSRFGMTYTKNADCDDYDCQGVGNCPTSENPSGEYPEWCFDGADNDLDGLSDCNDPDCILARNPYNVSIVCFPYEMNASALLDDNATTTSMQFCGNNFDDENNDTDNSASPSFSYNSIGFYYTGLRSERMDCNDLDCRQKFGGCAPCSNVELVEWDSCFDGFDNDHDSFVDSSDSDCNGQIINDRGYNSTNLPSNETSCSNGFDDDEDGKIDCLDEDCYGKVFSPDGRTCRYAGAGSETGANCSDNYDNDNDDEIDCYDSDCYSNCGIDAISGNGITHAPTNSSFSLTGDVTINGEASTIVRRGGDLFVSYSGSGIGGVTIILGSYATNEVINTSVFDVSNAQFTDNPDGFSMDKSNADKGYLTFTKSSISSFSFTVKIPGKGVVADPFTVKSTAEIGTNTASGSFSTQVVNNKSPEIDVLKIAPSGGNISAGDKLQVIVGNFTGYSGGQINSGQAGRCKINVTGPNGFSVEEYRNDCKSSNSNSWKIYSSGTYVVQATIYDNTGNEGNTIIDSVYLDVSPSIYVNLARTSEKRVFFSSSNSNYDSFGDEFNDISGTLTASFVTDKNNAFTSDSCKATIRDINNNVVSVQDIAGEIADNGYQINCIVDAKLSELSSDGLYRVSVNATDSRGYTIETRDIVFFKCDSLLSSGDTWNCSLADFDVDGYTEGVYQPFSFSNNNQTLYNLTCDSCPGTTNAGRDTDGDGYDNSCDAICGDGFVDGDEECDDANTMDGDGCDSHCKLEVPAGAEAGGGAAAPGGAGGALWFKLEPDTIDVMIRQGQTITQKVKITNYLPLDLNITIDYSNLSRFIIIKDSNFTIPANGSKVIEVEIFAAEDEIPEVYQGIVSVAGNGREQTLKVIIEVKEKRALFDIITKVKTKGVKPGGRVTAEINITNIGNLGPLNATLYNAVKDFSDNVIVYSEENIIVNDSLVVERSLKLPKNITPEKDYLFYSKITYEESYATSADSFKVTKKGVIVVFLVSMIILIIILGIIAFLIKKDIFALFKAKSKLKNLKTEQKY